ncbi:MAG: hypothetical protein DRP70_13400 [Spirochaetes bacterium]|nr:MAG: hypothetical protein DRP49_05155 [Spirochaetota bacterium]RKX84332.1 MAG: hypothetical protein DRP70_13400 [Spirochaetota bacterium]
MSGSHLTVSLFILLVLPVFLSGLTPGQSPTEEQWLNFMKINPGISRIPEDEKMGLLAGRRNPDALWESALIVCDSAFESIRKGEVPGDVILPAVRVPLSLAFSRVLSGGGKEISYRYALPRRDGNRISVQVRLSGDGKVSYGFIYLVRQEEKWFIDQWMLDLSEYPDVEKNTVEKADDVSAGENTSITED